MRPEIETYLQSNGSRYTTKALRQQLIHSGHDPAEALPSQGLLPGNVTY